VLFLHISIFLVAILFYSFAYIKPTIPRLNRLFVSKEPDEYNRVLELIGNLAKSQDKTEELIGNLAKSQDKTEELIGNLAKSQAKTEIKLRQLIGYNSNRDQELEDAIEEALFRKLQDSGWNVVRVGFTEIYQDNRLILEWDGIIEAKHVESSRNVLFVIETKQIFTVEKFESFRKRFAKMKKSIG